MSRSRIHAHSRDRWRNSRKAKSWSRTKVRRAQYAREAVEGLVEFEDTMMYWGRPLDYVSRAFLHVWRAAEDRRSWGRRAIDRTRYFTRPGSFDALLHNVAKSMEMSETRVERG